MIHDGGRINVFVILGSRQFFQGISGFCIEFNLNTCVCVSCTIFFISQSTTKHQVEYHPRIVRFTLAIWIVLFFFAQIIPLSNHRHHCKMWWKILPNDTRDNQFLHPSNSSSDTEESNEMVYLDSLQIDWIHYCSLKEFHGGEVSFEKALQFQVGRFSLYILHLSFCVSLKIVLIADFNLHFEDIYLRERFEWVKIHLFWFDLHSNLKHVRDDFAIEIYFFQQGKSSSGEWMFFSINKTDVSCEMSVVFSNASFLFLSNVRINNQSKNRNMKKGRKN